MTGLGALFLMAATSGDQGEMTTSTPKPRSNTGTIFKMCQGDCMEQTPHELKAGYSQCVICGNKIYAKPVESTDQNDSTG